MVNPQQDISLHIPQTHTDSAFSAAREAQGLLLQLGGLWNAFFLLLISLNTGWSLYRERSTPLRLFFPALAAATFIPIVLVALGPAIVGMDYWSEAGYWVRSFDHIASYCGVEWTDRPH